MEQGDPSSFNESGFCILKNLIAKEKLEAVERSIFDQFCKVSSVSPGGINYFQFKADDQVSIEPVQMSGPEISHFFDNIFLVWTGELRDAHAILAEQNRHTDDHLGDLKAMSDLAADL